MAQPSIADLRAACRGQVVTREDADYEAARKVYNGMIDRHPHVVVRAADAADVIAAVNFARDKALSKKLAVYHRIRTPGFMVFPLGQRQASLRGFDFPVIVKSFSRSAPSSCASAQMDYVVWSQNGATRGPRHSSP